MHWLVELVFDPREVMSRANLHVGPTEKYGMGRVEQYMSRTGEEGEWRGQKELVVIEKPGGFSVTATS